MYRKPMTYTDFDGNERKETFYFNLTKAECMEMEMGTTGGLSQLLRKIIDAGDNAELIAMFKKIIMKAYGEKSEDGKYFVKNDEVRAKFEATQAYSDLYMQLSTDTEEAIKFVENIMPPDLEDAIKEAAKKQNITVKS